MPTRKERVEARAAQRVYTIKYLEEAANAISAAVQPLYYLHTGRSEESDMCVRLARKLKNRARAARRVQDGK
jgi:hypothetical protein